MIRKEICKSQDKHENFLGCPEVKTGHVGLITGQGAKILQACVPKKKKKKNTKHKTEAML